MCSGTPSVKHPQQNPPKPPRRQPQPLRSSPGFSIDDRSRRTPSSSPAQDSGPSSHERGFESRWGRKSKLARSLIFLPRNRPSGFSDRGFAVVFHLLATTKPSPDSFFSEA